MSSLILTTHVILFFVFSYINIFIHESGHLIAAKSLGIPVKKVFIGDGSRLFSFNAGTVEIILTIGLKGGLTVPYLIKGQFFKRRFFLFTSGGILLQSFIFVIYSRFYDFHLSPFLLSNHIDISVCFMLATIVSVIFNTVPMAFTFKNTVIFNDGLLLLLLPFITGEKVIQLIVTAMNNNGVLLLERKQFYDAEVLLKEAMNLCPEFLMSSINLSTALMKSRKTDEAINVLEKIDIDQCTKSTAAAVNNNLAWAYLLKFDRYSLCKARICSQLACTLDPKNQKYIQNRAAVLIASNNYTEGLTLLQTMTDKNSTALSLLFTAYAYWQSGDYSSAIRFYRLIENDESQKDRDYTLLREIIVEKTGCFGGLQKSA